MGRFAQMGQTSVRRVAPPFVRHTLVQTQHPAAAASHSPANVWNEPLLLQLSQVKIGSGGGSGITVERRSQWSTD